MRGPVWIWPPTTAPVRTNTTMRKGNRFMVSSLQHELEANDPAPGRTAIRDGIGFRILDLLADPVELQFDPSVEGPVHPQRQGLLAAWKYTLRPGISEGAAFAGAIDAV